MIQRCRTMFPLRLMCRLLHVSPHHVSLHDDRVHLHGRKVEVRDAAEDFYTDAGAQSLTDEEIGAIFIRTDPPFAGISARTLPVSEASCLKGAQRLAKSHQFALSLESSGCQRKP